MDYTLIRSARRTVSLQIKEDATLVVRAPLHMPQAEIDRLLRDKERWIAKHTDSKKGQQAAKASFALADGDSLLLMGREYPLREREGTRAGFDGTCFYVPAGLSAEGRRAAVVHVYKMLARKILAGKVDAYAGRMGLAPKAVKVNSARTRWGSCSGQGNLNFSWRLVMAGEKEIDYVVVHELAHLKEMNHSPRFWAAVERAVPDCAERRLQLKAVQEKLSRENWA